MRASELIEKLQKIMAENGDVEIVYKDNENWPDYFSSIDKVDWMPNRFGGYWVIQ